MEGLCNEFLDLDMENKYYTTVAYDSDDPDFTWHEQCSDSEEFKSSSTNLSDSSAYYPDLRNNNTQGHTVGFTGISNPQLSNYSYPDIRAKPEFDTKNDTPKHRLNSLKSKDPMKFHQIEILPNRRSEEISDSDTDSTAMKPSRWDQLSRRKSEGSVNDVNSMNIVRKHRQTISGSSSKNLEKGNSAEYEGDKHANNTKRKGARSVVTDSTPPNVHGVPSPSNDFSPVLNHSSTLPHYSTSILNATYPPKDYLQQDANLKRTSTSFQKYRNSSPSYRAVNYEAENSTFRTPTKRPKRSIRDEIMPSYKNYQLVGDSQLLRFSEQILQFKQFINSPSATTSRRLGYCVSGQKIRDLLQRIQTEEHKISNKLILLIGTNDFVYHTDLISMQESFTVLLNVLKQKADHIVVLTVPPVPKLTNLGIKHMEKLKQFNQFLKKQADGRKVFVVDLASLFISYSDTISRQYYENFLNKYSGKPKPDLIHLNLAGFKLLKAILDIQYFDKLS